MNLLHDIAYELLLLLKTSLKKLVINFDKVYHRLN